MIKTDLNLVLTLAGILATIIFGVIGIWIYKVKRYPGRIKFVPKNNFNIYTTASTISGHRLEINYSGHKIDKNVNIVSGYLYNDGNIDISNSMVDEKLRIIFPEGVLCLDGWLLKKSKGMKPEISLNNNEYIIDLGLFRISEFVQFELLVESKQDFRFDDLKFHQRIEKTDKVTQVNYSKNPSFTWLLIGMFIAIGISIGLFFIPTDFGSTWISTTHYEPLKCQTPDSIISQMVSQTPLSRIGNKFSYSYLTKTKIYSQITADSLLKCIESDFPLKIEGNNIAITVNRDEIISEIEDQNRFKSDNSEENGMLLLMIFYIITILSYLGYKITRRYIEIKKFNKIVSEGVIIDKE